MKSGNKAFSAGNDCKYSEGNALETRPGPIWVDSESCLLQTSPYHDYTNADATFVWVTVYLVIDIFWGLSAALLFPGTYTFT